MILTVAKYAGALSAIFMIVAGAWTFADAYGFRPALKAEVEAVAANVEVVAQSVDWLNFENYEKLITRGVKLTRRQCADYRRLAKRLGVPAKAC